METSTTPAQVQTEEVFERCVKQNDDLGEGEYQDRDLVDLQDRASCDADIWQYESLRFDTKSPNGLQWPNA